MEIKKGKAKATDTLKTYATMKKGDGMPAPKYVVGNSMGHGFSKQAMFTGGQYGGGDVTTQPTFWYDPALTPDAWLLPKSRVETLRFCQIYYNLDPYIHSIINMHAQYGFSKFYLQYKDPNITALFNKLLFSNPEFDWYQFTLDIALSYYKYGEACLVGSTKIRLLDGTTKTLKELCDSKAKDFLVYSLDTNGNIVPGKADEVVLTRKNAKVLEIKLDNGESFKCTPDHLCMLCDGSYVEAQTLKAGDSLMTLYTKHMSERMKEAWKNGVYKNHKVISVIQCQNEDVYDIHSAGTYHNFALDCGVFVHNCVWGDWSVAHKTWNRFTILNPSIVEYKEDMVTGHATMELIPTAEMKKIVKDALISGRNDLDPMLVDAITNGKKLPLDTEGVPENAFTGQDYIPPKVFMFQRRTDPSSERGTSAIQCLFKTLIYSDQLRMSQMAVAQKTQLPIELWTVGHMGSSEEDSMLPGPELLEEVRQMITQATQQPPFSIVYGPYLKYEALGVAGKLLDIYNDLGYVENQVLVGLGVNKAVVLGEGPSVQGKAIALNRLIREYAVVRDLFSNWFKRNILLPIAKANHLVDEYDQYILPDLVWELSLQPEQDKETFDMFYKMWKDGLISTMTLFEKCPKHIDYSLEMQRLTEEVDTVFNKGDKRLGKKVEDSAAGGDEGGGLLGGDGDGSDGKGNPALRDLVLGGEGESNELDGLGTDFGIGDSGDSGDSGDEGGEEAPAE